MANVYHLFNRHFEWIAFTAALIVMGSMNPYIEQGASWCFFEMMGITFCPGHGLGHSIAYTFRGDLTNALRANMLGPFAIIILSGRIIYLLKYNITKN